jgi:hypothetical protein
MRRAEGLRRASEANVMRNRSAPADVSDDRQIRVRAPTVGMTTHEIELKALMLASLALQLPFCFEVRALSGSLVSSAPRRPCDDVCGLNTVTSESDGNAADFLD